jgi:hypothetical protein
MANKIRLFLRELFGSRLTERLEEDLLRQRQDFEARLQDKDQVIADLRVEKATLMGKIVLYERTLLRVDVEKTGAPKKPIFDFNFSSPRPVSRWEQVQAEHDKQLAEEAEREKASAKGA